MDINLTEITSPKKETAKKESLIKRIKLFFENPKKRLIFISSVGVLAIIIFAIGIKLLTRGENTTITTSDAKKETVQEEPKFEAPLDGVMTDKASTERYPLGIIVENHPDSRPQAGLNKASIIYEAIAEGGITRFLAIFGTNEAEKVGPVRSVRTYFVDWAHGYNAYLAHVGGNMDALDKIPADKILDLDQFKYSSPYWREGGGKVATEHTMFTSTEKLRQQAEKNKYTTSPNFTIYKYKDDPEASLRPEAHKVAVNFSSADFNVAFEYDKSTNSYKRLLAGKSHTDRVTGEQLNPKNIVVMTVKKQPTVTRINEPGYNMTTIGTGNAKFIMDGQLIEGTWKKDSADQRELFYDNSGNEITFDRGQLWICVIPPEGTVKIQ